MCYLLRSVWSQQARLLRQEFRLAELEAILHGAPG